jgi:hypothetical protein
MSGHGWVRLVVMVCMMCTYAWCMVGCASSKTSARGEQASSSEVMYGPPADDGPITVPQGAPLAEGYAVNDQGRSAVSPEASIEATSEPGTNQVTRVDLEQVLARGPGWGLVHVKVRPVKSEGGSLLGYEIYELTEGANLWMTPAIQIGDRITHLNGVKIKTPDDYMQAWNLARDVEELRIDYVRDGEANYSSWSVVD